MQRKRAIAQIVITLVLTTIFLGISLIIVYPGLKQMKEANQLLRSRERERPAKKSTRKTVPSTPVLPKTSAESHREEDSTIENSTLPENEPLEDEGTRDIPVETGVEEDVEEEAPTEENRISPEEQKLLEEGAAIIEEAKARRTEMLKAWEPIMIQMAAQLNSMSGEEQRAFVIQVEETLRDTMPLELTESDFEEMMKLFVDKLKHHGFSPRY